MVVPTVNVSPKARTKQWRPSIVAPGDIPQTPPRNFSSPKGKKTFLGSGRLITMMVNLYQNIRPSSPAKVLPSPVVPLLSKEEQKLQENEQKNLSIIIAHTQREHEKAVKRQNVIEAKKLYGDNGSFTETDVIKELLTTDLLTTTITEEPIQESKLIRGASVCALFPMEPLEVKMPPPKKEVPKPVDLYAPKKKKYTPEQAAAVARALTRGGHHQNTKLGDIIFLEC